MSSSYRYFKNLFWLFLLFTMPLPLIVALNKGLPSLYADSLLGINLGIFAYAWLLMVIYLSAKPKWIDRFIGLPDMYLIHGFSALFSLILMIVHKMLLPATGLVKLTGSLSLILFIGLTIYSLVFFAGWLTSRVSLLKTIKHWLEKTFKHEISIWLHRLNLVATILAYFHVLAIDYIRDIGPFFFLFTLYTIISFATYIWHLIASRKYPGCGQVTAVTHLDASVLEITIQVAKKLAKKIRPGDFIFVSFPDNKNLVEAPPFSVINNPGGSGEVKLAIDQAGDFTQALKDLEPGMEAYLSAGYGVLHRLINESAPDGKIVLIGGGIGVVPLMSLADHFEDRDILFFYTVERSKNILYPEKIGAWENRANFKSYVQKGRFTEEQLDDLLPINKGINYFIAGPMGMILAYEKMLMKKGVSKNNIFYESFNW